ncbi:hypothetical protein MSG28_004562 [Choristoneura fumiferana]|uniref:Uncharacterized protein n=1 Tax=Choristoneura fumiferana TaxID=7141 RepID=A0ACC0K6K6_CHOFU|nr:hypothetical protein MSG28_004562 [Choristoneura fumiferana]
MSEERAASLFRGNVARLRLFCTPPPSPYAETESSMTPQTFPQHYQVLDELESLFPTPSHPIIRRTPKCRRQLNFTHITIRKNIKKKRELPKKVAQEQKQPTAELSTTDTACMEQVDAVCKEQVPSNSEPNVLKIKLC